MTGVFGSDVEGIRIELRQLLDRAERWLENAPLDGDEFDDEQRRLWADSIHTIRSLRTRAVSALINVAFVGEFSSGKSFLIGGLQERLEYAPVTNDDGMTSEQYVGLLHSASKASTACPATVVPIEASDEVDGSGRGFYRVSFTDAHGWEDLGNSPLPAVVAAYTTADPKAVTRGRHARDRERTVAEVEIQLADPVLPAKLYDLPGLNAVHPVHDEIATSAWVAADCFVYISQATHTLSRFELDLIGRLYKHHLSSGKRVIWVLTAIDRAVSANIDDQPEWMDTVEANNAYLAENFPAPDGRPDTFLGTDGFIPVSPAWEARGKWHLARGETAAGGKLIAASRMRRLRRAFTDLVNTETGVRHLSVVAAEARASLLPRQRMLVELLESARLPLDRLSDERDALSYRLQNLKSATGAIREQLEAALRQHVRLTERSFQGLADLLRIELVGDIREANLTRDKETNRLEVRKAQLLQEWVANRGPQQVWQEQFTEFTEGVLNTVRVALRDTDPAGNLNAVSTRLDITDLAVPPSERYRIGTRDILQRVSGFVGLSTPLAATAAAAAGLVSGPLLAVPAGVTLVAGLVYALIVRHRASSSELEMLRQQWIDGLDQTAAQYREAFVTAAKIQGIEMMDRAMEILSERTDELSRRIILVENRLAEPANADRSETVAALEPHVRAGTDILDGFRTLFT